jgi:hypothetical protein
MSFVDYYTLIASIKPAVESFTGSAWAIPTWAEIAEWASSYDEQRRDPNKSLLAYDYLAHLRHNGFPSPLLDWTASPYVAAFFAFSRPQADEVAIYAFSETPKNIKVGGADEPQIRTLGPIVKTHRRHFRQQSRYTICANFLEGVWQFARHQEVFDLNMPDQDLTWKLIMPASEHLKVLSILSSMNVNAFSLFDTEDSLMEMLAVEHLDLQRAKVELRKELAAAAAAEKAKH